MSLYEWEFTEDRPATRHCVDCGEASYEKDDGGDMERCEGCGDWHCESHGEFCMGCKEEDAAA